MALPLGRRSFLDHVAATISGIADGALLVMPTFPYDPEYERVLQSMTALTVRVIPPIELTASLNEYEPADYLLVIDPTRWPVDGFDLDAVVRDHGEYRGATHGVAIGADAESTREYIERDEEGNVRRVQRFYRRMSWPDAAGTQIFFSLVPVRSVGDVCFTSLAQLRAALSAKGVLNRDIPVPSDPIDLKEEADFLTLSERMLTLALSRPDQSYSKKRNNVMIGGNCSVHESARVVGPVIIHDGVTIEEGATVVGPTLVGAGSSIGRGATIAHSVIAANTVVDHDATILSCVGSGSCSNSTVDSPVRAQRSYAFKPSGRQQHTDGDLGTSLGGLRGYRRVHLAVKRLMDVVLASAGLLVLSPVLGLVAVLIKLESPGPVFFVHRRERRNGKDFPCLKFRTMVKDAHRQQRELYRRNEVDGPQFKINRDPRLTRLGPWLRSTNIDELPQLINVLLGHMSLVGPRPSPFRENQICVPWRRARLSVRPGVTGLWQLCRDNREAGDFNQWIYYDLAYVRNLSVWLDIKVLFATVFTLAGRWNVPLCWLVHGEDGGGGPDVVAYPVRATAFS